MASDLNLYVELVSDEGHFELIEEISPGSEKHPSKIIWKIKWSSGVLAKAGPSRPGTIDSSRHAGDSHLKKEAPNSGTYVDWSLAVGLYMLAHLAHIPITADQQAALVDAPPHSRHYYCAVLLLLDLHTIQGLCSAQTENTAENVDSAMFYTKGNQSDWKIIIFTDSSQKPMRSPQGPKFC
jgi:hypothetical protein